MTDIMQNIYSRYKGIELEINIQRETRKSQVCRK